MKNLSFSEFCIQKKVKLTALRKEILSILFKKNQPMGAYEILDKLKKRRASAEPPTVYRVLEWLVNAKLIHRIDAQNTFVCCSMFEDDESIHKTILLLCKNCQKSRELEDEAIMLSIKKFVEKHAIEVDDAVIELKGTCDKCLAMTHAK